MLEKKETDRNLTIVLIILVSILLGVFVGYNIGKTNVIQNVNKLETSNSETEEKVNINKATYEELLLIDGIGDTKAKNIIKNRPYENIHDLLKKDVMGEDLFKKIKERLVV